MGHIINFQSSHPIQVVGMDTSLVHHDLQAPTTSKVLTSRGNTGSGPSKDSYPPSALFMDTLTVNHRFRLIYGWIEILGFGFYEQQPI